MVNDNNIPIVDGLELAKARGDDEVCCVVPERPVLTATIASLPWTGCPG